MRPRWTLQRTHAGLDSDSGSGKQGKQAVPPGISTNTVHLLAGLLLSHASAALCVATESATQAGHVGTLQTRRDRAGAPTASRRPLPLHLRCKPSAGRGCTLPHSGVLGEEDERRSQLLPHDGQLCLHKPDINALQKTRGHAHTQFGVPIPYHVSSASRQRLR